MATDYALQLKCDSIVPTCGYRCGPCLQEIQDVLIRTGCVTDLSIEGSHEHARLAFTCDDTMTSADIKQILMFLPTMHDGNFVAIIVTNRGM